MRILTLIVMLFSSGVVSHAQTAPVKFFTLATHSVTADTSWQNWKVLSKKKLKVSFSFSTTAIQMVMPLRTETMPIVQKFRKNGAIIYLVKDTATSKALVIVEENGLRYIVQTSRNRFFQTCYTNTYDEANLSK